MKDYIKSEAYYTIYAYSVNGDRVKIEVTDLLVKALRIARNSGYKDWQIEKTEYFTNLPF